MTKYNNVKGRIDDIGDVSIFYDLSDNIDEIE